MGVIHLDQHKKLLRGSICPIRVYPLDLFNLFHLPKCIHLSECLACNWQRFDLMTIQNNGPHEEDICKEECPRMPRGSDGAAGGSQESGRIIAPSPLLVTNLIKCVSWKTALVGDISSFCSQLPWRWYWSLYFYLVTPILQLSPVTICFNFLSNNLKKCHFPDTF